MESDMKSLQQSFLVFFLGPLVFSGGLAVADSTSPSTVGVHFLNGTVLAYVRVVLNGVVQTQTDGKTQIVPADTGNVIRYYSLKPNTTYNVQVMMAGLVYVNTAAGTGTFTTENVATYVYCETVGGPIKCYASPLNK